MGFKEGSPLPVTPQRSTMSNRSTSSDTAGSPPGRSQLVPLDRLGRYLPPELAERVAVQQRTAGAPSGPLLEAFVHLAAARYTIATYLPHLLVRELVEERRESPWILPVEGSLLYADLSGSTALAERLGALGREGTELLTDALNDIFASMIQVIEGYGGDLVTFGGDALLVFFCDERHPRTAARAALALQEAMRGYERHVPGAGAFRLSLHVGVESGAVWFAGAGLPHSRYPAVLGSTANRVARAEALARPGELVVGPGSWEVLQHFATEWEEVAPGFVGIRAMRPPAKPHEPLPPEPPIVAPPEAAIPELLDDLDRISPYVPQALRRRILASPELPQLEADLRPVTVLFAQVDGLAELVERLPRPQAARTLQSYVAEMQAVVEQFGGVVNKLDVADVGLRLVALFGAPAAYEDHAERGARAALEMQARLRQGFGEGDALPADLHLQQRIGLNLGTAFAGNVGSVTRKEYTVMGDAVNVAARVMGEAGWGEVWCSEASAEAVGARLLCEARGAVHLRGKSAPLPLFRVAGLRESPATTQPEPGGQLVGREQELAWLRGHLEAALAGEGRALRIAGDAGVGKSRLAAALMDEARARGARVLAVPCYSYAATIPYAACGEWLKALCGIVSADGEAARTEKLAARLADLGPGMDEWLPLLGELLRLTIADNRLTRGLDPQLRQARRFELLEQLLLRAATGGPLLAVCEDLHWADPISLAFWSRITGSLDGRPILLVGVHRPPSELASGDRAAVLELRELSAVESQELARALAHDARLPPELLERLVDRAAGNPLFLTELLRAVQPKLRIADWRLQSEGQEQAAISNLQSAIESLPDSLSGLLLARIDQLDETSRGVLRVASVIGQRIPFGVLQSIHVADQEALVRQLTRLDAQELTVLERLEPERVHTFRHALIQEVAYQSMLYARRRDLHGRIGAYLERRYAADLDDYLGLLAHHYRLSDRREKAVEYLLKAGHAAQASYANDEAEQYYRWALEALGDSPDDPRGWEAREGLAEISATVGRYDEALAQHAVVLGARAVPAEISRRAHRGRGIALERQGQYAAALDELDLAMAIARSGTAGVSRLGVAQISADVAQVHKRRGDYDAAIAACELGLSQINRDDHSHEDELIEARLHSELGGIYGMRGDYTRSRHHFERSLQAREAVDDLPGVVISHNNLGFLWQLQGEHEKALGNYAIADRLARRINLRVMLAFTTLNTAWALSSLGRYADAENRCGESLALARELNARHTVAQAQNTLGIILYHTGAYGRALQALDVALEINRSLGAAYQAANTLVHIATTLTAEGRCAESEQMAREAYDHAEQLRSEQLKVEALTALAEAQLGSGDAGGAIDSAAVAAEQAERLGKREHLGMARRILGQARAAVGTSFEADFEASAALFEAIKNPFELGRTWAAYGLAALDSGDRDSGLLRLKKARDTFIALGANGELERFRQIFERSV